MPTAQSECPGGIDKRPLTGALGYLAERVGLFGPSLGLTPPLRCGARLRRSNFVPDEIVEPKGRKPEANSGAADGPKGAPLDGARRWVRPQHPLTQIRQRPLRGRSRIWRRGWDCSAHPWASPLRCAAGPACGGPISFLTKLSNPKAGSRRRTAAQPMPRRARPWMGRVHPGGFVHNTRSPRYANAPCRGRSRIWRRGWDCSARPWASPLRCAAGPACGGPISFLTKLSNPKHVGSSTTPAHPDTPTPPVGGARVSGGEGGIRTHGGIATTPVFKTGAFDHSATSPGSSIVA